MEMKKELINLLIRNDYIDVVYKYRSKSLITAFVMGRQFAYGYLAISVMNE